MTQQNIDEDEIRERLEASERTIEDLKGSLESTLLLLGGLTSKYTALMDRYEAKNSEGYNMAKSIADLIQLDTAEISGMFAVGLATQGKLEKLVGDAQKKATAAVRKDINKWKKTWESVDDEGIPPAFFEKIMPYIKENANLVTPNADDVASYIDVSDLSDYIDIEEVAGYICESGVANQLCLDNLATNVAGQIDIESIASYVEAGDVADYFAAATIADSIDKDALSEKIVDSEQFVKLMEEIFAGYINGKKEMDK